MSNRILTATVVAAVVGGGIFLLNKYYGTNLKALFVDTLTQAVDEDVVIETVTNLPNPNTKDD